jgi:hypothetical protein
MRLPLLALLALFTFDTLAQEFKFKVLLRQEGSNNSYYKDVALEDLESPDSFNGRYFKIVNGKSNEAISFANPDSKLVLKAANTYYHLTEARRFWLHNLESDLPNQTPKIVVRLNITNIFDELGHFAHDNRSPQYNNALSIPEGETPSWVPEHKQDKWNKEIWFRPLKMVDTKELLHTMGPNPLTIGLQEMESPFLNHIQNRFNQTIVEHLFYPNYVVRPLKNELIRMAGTVAIAKFLIFASKKADKLFIDKWYYLDTAMVPEVIYHEYAHIILSDHLEMSHSTPVNEGMADYFAAVLSKKRKVYGKIPGYSNANPKDTQNDKPYVHWDESNQNAAADFVLAVLWDVRETLGEEIGDKVVYEARKRLKTQTATIADHLLRSILIACENVCESPRRDKLKLYETFSKRGF